MNTESKPKPSQFQTFLANLAKQQNEALFQLLIKENIRELRPRLTFTKLIAYIYAGLFHLLNFSIFALALYLTIGIFFSRPLTIALCPNAIGVILFLLVWTARPRFRKLPKHIISRADAPILYHYADRIAHEFGIAPVSAIVLADYYNAAFTRIGFPRKTVLILGIPLLESLSGQENVALLAHELAHGANGDAARTFFIESARNSTIGWRWVLYPETLKSSGVTGILLLPLNFLATSISQFLKLNTYILHYLLSWESRRAEYLADYLASKIAGTDTTRILLGKLYFAESFNKLTEIGYRVGQLSYAEKRRNELREEVAALSLEELEQICEPDPEEIARFDLSHPPIGYRMQLLKAHPILKPKLQLSEEANQKFLDEIHETIKKYKKRNLSVYDQDFEYKPSQRYKNEI